MRSFFNEPDNPFGVPNIPQVTIPANELPQDYCDEDIERKVKEKIAAGEIDVADAFCVHVIVSGGSKDHSDDPDVISVMNPRMKPPIQEKAFSHPLAIKSTDERSL